MHDFHQVPLIMFSLFECSVIRAWVESRDKSLSTSSSVFELVIYTPYFENIIPGFRMKFRGYEGLKRSSTILAWIFYAGWFYANSIVEGSCLTQLG